MDGGSGIPADIGAVGEAQRLGQGGITVDKTLKARLRKLSKEDLLWVIERMCAHKLDNSPYYLNCALSDLECDKELQKINDADRYAKLAYRERTEYIELLKSFEGKNLSEIPLDAVKKAERLRKEAAVADKQWAKLSGFKEA